MGLLAIHGKNAIIYLGGTSATAIPVAEEVDYDLNLTDSFAETSSLNQTWETYVKGMIGWTGKITGNFDPTSLNLWDASLSGSAQNLYLYPIGATSMTQYYYGTAFVMLKTLLSGGTKKAITNSIDLKGTGALSRN